MKKRKIDQIDFPSEIKANYINHHYYQEKQIKCDSCGKKTNGIISCENGRRRNILEMDKYRFYPRDPKEKYTKHTCTKCAIQCSICKKYNCDSQKCVNKCVKCYGYVCNICQTKCIGCKQIYCSTKCLNTCKCMQCGICGEKNDSFPCKICGKQLCEKCNIRCKKCNSSVCIGCKVKCIKCNTIYCSSKCYNSCACHGCNVCGSNDVYDPQYKYLKSCISCKKVACNKCLSECAAGCGSTCHDLCNHHCYHGC